MGVGTLRAEAPRFSRSPAWETLIKQYDDAAAKLETYRARIYKPADVGGRMTQAVESEFDRLAGAEWEAVQQLLLAASPTLAAVAMKTRLFVAHEVQECTVAAEAVRAIGADLDRLAA
jgi:hypothetical protein